MADDEKPQRPQPGKEQPVEQSRDKGKGVADDDHGKMSQSLGKDNKLASGSSKQKAGGTQSPTLMSAAVSNLLIAQQYIDETKFTIEHKLVSFHYGVALLADGREDPEKRNLAKQYFTAAAGWMIPENAAEPQKKAVARILCESQYNLGVIEELNGNYGAARERYSNALDIVVGPFLAFRDDAPSYSGSELGDVALLAHLGWISSVIPDLRQGAPAAGADEKKLADFNARLAFPLKQAAILRRQIGEFKGMAYKHVHASGKANQESTEQHGQRGVSTPSAVSYKHEILDAVLKRVDAFFLELYELAPDAAKQQP